MYVMIPFVYILKGYAYMECPNFPPTVYTHTKANYYWWLPFGRMMSYVEWVGEELSPFILHFSED